MKSEEPKEVMHVTHGRDQSGAIYTEGLKKAKKTYYILGWKLERVGDKYFYLNKFKELLKRGVDVKLILTGKKQKHVDLINDYKEEGIKLKYIPFKNFSIFIVDNKECKITLKGKDVGERINLHIKEPSFAKSMHNYFCDLWDSASFV